MMTHSYTLSRKGSGGDLKTTVKGHGPSSPQKNDSIIRGYPSASGNKTTLVGPSSKSDSLGLRLSTIKFFDKISAKTGNVIKLDEEFGFFPVILREDGIPIPLYYFIEVIDELLDYEKLKEEFPELTYSQIESTVDFIRKISAINIFGADIDVLENGFDENDTSLIRTLQEATADGYNKRVLYNDK